MFKNWNLELLRLLADTSIVENEKIEIAYGCFKEHMKTVGQSENDYSEIFRMLNIARSELVFLQSLHRYEEGGNALKFAYLRKAVLFLESEIYLLKLTFPQENHPVKNKLSETSKIYFIPKPQGLGIDSIAEIAVSFQLCGQFFDKAGKPASLLLISEGLEKIFNFSFGDIYKSKVRIFKRKPFNLTKALDYLGNLISRESRKKKMKKDGFIKR